MGSLTTDHAAARGDVSVTIIAEAGSARSASAVCASAEDITSFEFFVS
jgi:hypothetical protein